MRNGVFALVDNFEVKLFDKVGNKLITCSKIVFWVGTVLVIIACLLSIAGMTGVAGCAVQSEYLSVSEKVGYSGLSLLSLLPTAIWTVAGWLGVWIVSNVRENDYYSTE